MTDPTNALARGGLQALAQQRDRRAAADEKRIAWNVERARSWAGRQSRDDLELAFANLLALSFERKCLAIRLRQIKHIQADSLTILEVKSEVLHDVAKQEIVANLRNRQARQKGAEEKKKGDPVQQAKAGVKAMWDDWQSGRALHRSGAAFGRFVLSEVPAIQSDKTIERWCREWSAERQAPKPK